MQFIRYHAPLRTFVLIKVIFLAFFFLPPPPPLRTEPFEFSPFSDKAWACATRSSSCSKSFSHPCNQPSSSGSGGAATRGGEEDGTAGVPQTVRDVLGLVEIEAREANDEPCRLFAQGGEVEWKSTSETSVSTGSDVTSGWKSSSENRCGEDSSSGPGLRRLRCA